MSDGSSRCWEDVGASHAVLIVSEAGMPGAILGSGCKESAGKEVSQAMVVRRILQPD